MVREIKENIWYIEDDGAQKTLAKLLMEVQILDEWLG